MRVGLCAQSVDGLALPLHCARRIGAHQSNRPDAPLAACEAQAQRALMAKKRGHEAADGIGAAGGELVPGAGGAGCMRLSE